MKKHENYMHQLIYITYDFVVWSPVHTYLSEALAADIQLQLSPKSMYSLDNQTLRKSFVPC